MNFKDLNINEKTIDILKKYGITKPTPIQSECIGVIKEGRDVIAQSQTGTGKTLAFLIPTLEKININKKSVSALILTPTRELALQIYNEAEKLAQPLGINILSAYGGKDIKSQANKLKNNIHLIIATPGRLLDHLDRKTINLKDLDIFILDEADQMLLMGFKNEIDAILKETNKKRQSLFFSATMDSQVKKLAYRYTNEPCFIEIKSQEVTLEKIKQSVVLTTDRRKFDSFCKVLDEDNPFMAIVFCRTKRRADKLEEDMASKGYNCAKIHSDISQSKRERIMKNFRDMKIQYLIATDVASRGLDITGVTHIYNYDFPETSEDYIHRIGRTGRAGEDGDTCAFVTDKNKNILDDVEEKLGFNIDIRFDDTEI
ncbi:DEAD/DEAH box helicase [Peptacetobacter sp.]|uniref:DEAD/DEAH box helicase n=1 Tax=Peptacetobacter sp. TaxID=2991975 RepID=UPI0026392CBF|nr:DEAD/DEAH box helicase [Peptacetobacter sp.]